MTKKWPRVSMSPSEFQAALDELGLTHERAAVVLRAASRQRVGHWCNGDRDIPAYIAAHMDTLLELARCLEARGQRRRRTSA